VSIPFDHLAAHLDAGYEGLEGGQRHRAVRYLLAPPPEALVHFGGVDAVEPDQLIGDHNSVAVDDLGGADEAIGTPAERQNGNKTGRETSEHSATVHCQTYQWRSIGASGLRSSSWPEAASRD
jgi:hypothetical protein